MSEFSFSIFVKSDTLSEVIKYLDANITEGIVYPINTDWQAVVINERVEKYEQWAAQIAQGLNTYVFTFFYGEDHGWEYSLFLNGNKIGYLNVDYERDISLDAKEKAIQAANLTILGEIGGKQELLQKLEENVRNTTIETEEIIHSVDLFKQAFDFQGEYLYLFDELNSFSNQKLRELNAVKTTIKTKKLNLKKMILATLSDKLKKAGYIYDKEYQGVYAFLKDNNGFKMGLTLDKSSWGNVIRANLVSPSRSLGSMFYLTEGISKDFPYENENDLKKALTEILNQFLDKGINWIDNNKFHYFDVNKLYENEIDNMFAEISFTRVSTDEQILRGGKVIYKRDSQTIKISHALYSANLSYYLYKGEKEIDIISVIINKKKDSSNIIKLSFFDKNSYIDCIKGCIYCIKEFSLI